MYWMFTILIRLFSVYSFITLILWWPTCFVTQIAFSLTTYILELSLCIYLVLLIQLFVKDLHSIPLSIKFLIHLHSTLLNLADQFFLLCLVNFNVHDWVLIIIIDIPTNLITFPLIVIDNNVSSSWESLSIDFTLVLSIRWVIFSIWFNIVNHLFNLILVLYLFYFDCKLAIWNSFWYNFVFIAVDWEQLLFVFW